MEQPWERQVSATGSRLHWARPGQPYALCGSKLAEVRGGGGEPSPKLPDCGSCERKRAKLPAGASRQEREATEKRGPSP